MPAVTHRGRRGRRTINEINMVPFIDVMLVLLIIFMVTAPLIQPSLIDLPSVGKAARQPDQVIQVVITRSDRLELRHADRSSTHSASDIAAAVQAALRASQTGTRTAVVISADRQVAYEKVVKVMDALQRAGIARIGLSVQLVN